MIFVHPDLTPRVYQQALEWEKLLDLCEVDLPQAIEVATSLGALDRLRDHITLQGVMGFDTITFLRHGVYGVERRYFPTSPTNLRGFADLGFASAWRGILIQGADISLFDPDTFPHVTDLTINTLALRVPNWTLPYLKRVEIPSGMPHSGLMGLVQPTHSMRWWESVKWGRGCREIFPEQRGKLAPPPEPPPSNFHFGRNTLSSESFVEFSSRGVRRVGGSSMEYPWDKYLLRDLLNQFGKLPLKNLELTYPSIPLRSDET